MAVDIRPADFQRPRALHSGFPTSRDTCCGSLWHALVVRARRAVSRGGGLSGVLLFITDQLALIRAGVPLAQEVLTDGFQLRQL